MEPGPENREHVARSWCSEVGYMLGIRRRGFEVLDAGYLRLGLVEWSCSDGVSTQRSRSHRVS